MMKSLIQINYKPALFILILILLCYNIHATTYYISGTGDNSKTGTSPNTAWLSLSKISGITFSAGDQVLLEGGVTFSGTINISGFTGTSTNPVIFSSYGSGRAVISSGTNSGFYGLNSAGFVIKNINFVGAGYTLGTATGIYLRNALAAGIKLDYIVIDSVDVSGYNMNGITWTGVNAASGFSHLRITHAKVHDNGNGIVSGGVNVKTGYNITSWANNDVYIAYCEVYFNYGSPQINNTHTGDGILVRSTNKLLIEHCLSYNNGSRANSYPGGGCVGIWCTQCNKVLIQYCESHHIQSAAVDGDGFDIDGANTNAVLQYNYAHDNDGAGFLIYQYDNAGRMDSVTIRYNISENDGRNTNMGGIHINSGDKTVGGGVSHATVYNNTIYLTPSTVTGGAGVVAKGTINGLLVANNIIQTTGGVPLVGNIGTIPATFVGNLYWSTGSPFSVKWKGISYSSLAAWQSASNQETFNGQPTGIVADPSLVNPGQDVLVGNTDLLAVKLKDHYSLSSTSPAINKAFYDASLNLPRLPVDFFNTTIPAQGAFDVGAAQYANASSTVVLGIAKEDNDALSLSVYPNPADKQIAIKYNSHSASAIVLSIYDGLGKQVMNVNQIEANDEFALNIDHLNNGIYFVKLKVNNKQLVRRFVVSR